MGKLDNNARIIALLDCDNIGKSTIAKHVQKFKDPESAICDDAIKTLLSNKSQTSFKQYMALVDDKTLLIEKSKQMGINLVTILNKDLFPEKLFNRSSPIVHLYYRGNISLLQSPIIAVIGSRKTPENVLSLSKRECERIAGHGLVIVSGLAIGVDTMAHIGCLDAKGKTIAVLPSDLRSIIPSQNKELANRILESGGLLISEYSIGVRFDINHYRERDRIQSALSEAILVPFCSDNSGTMIAVRDALRNHKPVFQFAGNNNPLIPLTYYPGTDESLFEIFSYTNNKNSSSQLELF